jgi:hypothetical protein
MVLATFTHYVMNLFGGGGKLEEVPHEAGTQTVKVAEANKSVVDDAPATKEVATVSDGERDGVPAAEETTDESGTESAAAPVKEPSSSPSKRKRADGNKSGKQPEKESDVDSDDGEDSVLSTVPTDSAAKAPAKAGKAVIAATEADRATGDVPAAGSVDGPKAAAPGDDSRSTKRPRQDATPIASA